MLSADVEKIRGVLAGAGRTWTRPRSAVLRVLVTASAPLNADEIYRRLRGRPRGAPGERRVNLSSVYRTLQLLGRLQVVRQVQLGDGGRRYELAEGYRAHHHHFVCEGCGRIEDVARCPVEGAEWYLGGVTVRTHHLELFGLCQACAAPTGGRRVRV